MDGVGGRSAGCVYLAFPPLPEPSQQEGEFDPHLGSLLLSCLPWATGACFVFYLVRFVGAIHGGFVPSVFATGENSYCDSPFDLLMSLQAL